MPTELKKNVEGLLMELGKIGKNPRDLLESELRDLQNRLEELTELRTLIDAQTNNVREAIKIRDRMLK